MGYGTLYLYNVATDHSQRKEKYAFWLNKMPRNQQPISVEKYISFSPQLQTA